MRIPRAVFLASILVGPLALHAAQSPAPGAAPPAAAAPAPTASETLKPALVGVLQTLGSLKLDKWKRGSVREEAGSNIDTIQRDLEQTLPPLLKAADAAPTTISKVLPVTRNIDAIYDVLVHVFEAARVSAPGDQIAQLQQAMDSLEKARIKFGNHLQDTAEAQEKSLVDLRTTVQADHRGAARRSVRRKVQPPCEWQAVMSFVPDELRTNLVGVGDGGAGETCGGAAVGDRECESFVGWPTGDITEEVSEEAGVAGPDGADDGGGRRRRVPGARGADEHGAVGAERHEHALHPTGEQVARRFRGRDRVGLEVVAAVAGEGRELLAVGLHQVGRARRQGLDQGLERRVAGVDGHPGARAP